MTPVDTRGLFRPLEEELLGLLRSLGPEDWERRATPAWTVRDVAAHLLDGALRRLSFQRDALPLPAFDAPVAGFEAMRAQLDRLNADWILAARRLSPRVLVDLLALASPQLAELMERQDLGARAFFDVDWAGEHQSQAWLDVAREFTERWHHQQQVRLAVNAPLLVGSRWLRPLLAVSVLALPRVYADVPAAPGVAVSLRILGEAGGSWRLRRGPQAWRLEEGQPDEPAAATISLDQDAAWRIFFKMLVPEEARRLVRCEGEPALAEAFLSARAVMA